MLSSYWGNGESNSRPEIVDINSKLVWEATAEIELNWKKSLCFKTYLVRAIYLILFSASNFYQLATPR